MKNKRANIPIAIFVVGVMGVCALVLLSFSLSLRNTSNEIENSLGVVMDLNIALEKYYLYQNLGFSKEESLLAVQKSFKKDKTDIFIEEKERIICLERKNFKVCYGVKG